MPYTTLMKSFRLRWPLRSRKLRKKGELDTAAEDSDPLILSAVADDSEVKGRHGMKVEQISLKDDKKSDKISSPQVGLSWGKAQEYGVEAFDASSSAPVTVTFMEKESLWVRAEQLLREDDKKRRIWQASLDILEEEFGSRLQPTGKTDLRRQFCNLLDAKTRDLEGKKWSVRFGDHRIAVKDQLIRVFQNVLIAKDAIGHAANLSPPAAIACAGVTVVLSLVVQAAEQHAALLQGLESTSALISRLRVVEEIYLPRGSSQAAQFGTEFEETLTQLYAKILEFQARALCYLGKHSITQLLSDMFKHDGWDALVQEIDRLEVSEKRFADLLDAVEVREKLQTLQSAIDKSQLWQTTTARDEKASKLLRLLYTCPYKDRKERNNDRVPGTCEWFTSHVQFQSWNQNNGPNLLWVSADPGCGKSVLVKYLVDAVLPTRTRTVCYFFFKDDFEDQRSSTSALRTILQQLFLAQPHILHDLILDKVEADGAQLTDSFCDLWEILTSVANTPSSGEVVCVFDALDECREADRIQFTRAVKHLFIPEPRVSNLKFLITSRPYEHIRRGFWELEAQLPKIHLSGENEVEIEKIMKEIDLVINERISQIGKQKSLEIQECEFLQEQLTSIPNRTYLWVSLVIDVIENTTGFTKGDVRRAIQSLPRTVDDAYEKILSHSPDIDKAKTLLHIVTAAKEPLSPKQVSLAMAISPEHRSYTDLEEELESEHGFRRTVRDLCGLLLVIIDEKIYLLHQTAKEFLVRDELLAPLSGESFLSNSWKHCLQPEESNKVLAEKCIWYLSLANERFHGDPFFRYGAQYWPLHFRESCMHENDAIAAQALYLCKAGSNQHDAWVRFWTQCEYEKIGPAVSLWFPRAPTICIVSYLGLEVLVGMFLKDGGVDMNVKDPDFGCTPLSWAAAYGHEIVVKLLLHSGKVGPDSRDLEGKTPLSWAARRGHDKVVELLLGTGKVDPGSEDYSRNTPLSWAARGGHDKVVELLLDSGEVGPDFEVKSQVLDVAGVKSSPGHMIKVEETPLFLAADRGHDTVVKLLLDTVKFDPNFKYDLGLTLLSYAAQHGYEKVVRVLLDAENVDPESKDMLGRTPLSLAAMRGQESVVNLLITSGRVDPDSRDYKGRTPLSLAAMHGYGHVIKQLYDTGRVDPDSRDNDGRTPLSYAAARGHERALMQLYNTGKVNPDFRQDRGRTPLSFAAESGHGHVIKQLCATGRVNPDSRDIDGRTPLSYAAEADWGAQTAINCLLEVKRPNCVLLSHAAADERRRQSALKALLETEEVNVDSMDNCGRTPLSYAAAAKWLDPQPLEALLKTGKVNVESMDEDGRTPLSYAVEGWKKLPDELGGTIFSAVEPLLETGKVNIKSKDKHGRTPLSYAEGDGREALRKLLMDALQSKGESSSTIEVSQQSQVDP